MNLGVALLSAGKSSRFGKNKLLSEFAGRPMVCCAMDAVCSLRAKKTVVVTGYPEIKELAAQYGFHTVHNDAPEQGMSRSIRLAVEALANMDAIMLLVGDQPLLTSISLNRLHLTFEEGEKGIACLEDETHRGNPAVFSNAYFSELLALDGDRGAKAVIKAHENDLIVVSCVRANELTDCDDPVTLAKLNG